MCHVACGKKMTEAESPRMPSVHHTVMFRVQTVIETKVQTVQTVKSQRRSRLDPVLQPTS